jgi:hypothetical protein
MIGGRRPGMAVVSLRTIAQKQALACVCARSIVEWRQQGYAMLPG